MDWLRPCTHGRPLQLAVPLTPGEKFRVLAKIQLKGSFVHQANRIKDLTEKYNVQFIGIDANGSGIGVLDLVQELSR